MKLSKITHHHEVRIRVDFPYNAEITAKLKQIPDTRWSKTIKSWHIPYTKEVFEQLKEMFPEVEYETSPPTTQNLTPKLSPSGEEKMERGAVAPKVEQKIEKIKKILTIKNNEPIPKKIELASKKSDDVSTKPKPSEIKSAITLTIYPKIIELKIPKDEADIQFIRSFKYARWNKNMFCWTVPNKLSESEFTELYNLQNNKIHY